MREDHANTAKRHVPPREFGFITVDHEPGGPFASDITLDRANSTRICRVHPRRSRAEPRATRIFTGHAFSNVPSSDSRAFSHRGLFIERFRDSLFG